MTYRFRMPLFLLAFFAMAVRTNAADKPNIVYIMSDELAYFEVGYMGNPHIKTPRIDRMKEEGLMFTQALAGSPVCAPLRCNLMTGKHSGHASVRANGGGTPLVAGEATIASMLKKRGYATGGFGKWGCGGRGSTGVPEEHGFDVFFGYYDQVHAHSFYPPYLIRNSKEVSLKGNIGGRKGETYSHYEIMREGLDFIRKNKDQPFFCYLPITPPHGMYDIPESDPAWKNYHDKDWPNEAANYAAMVTMVDRNVGEVLDLLKELGLEENTIVFFTGDNGGQDRFKSKDHPRGFFGPNVNPKDGVEFRGGKGNLYEGGLRIPALVRWPGRVKPGQVSDLIWYQPDVLPTLAELTKSEVPEGVDGISILPEILGEDAVGRKQTSREMLYWEFGQQTAVRMGQWKAHRPKANAPWDLYDLTKDLSETTSVADAHPELLAKMTAFAKASHTPVVEGTFADRTNHEKDRWAKWGTSTGQKFVPPAEVNSIPKEGLIPSKGWKLIRASSENKGNRKFARNAFDGDSRSIWHTQFAPKLEKHPHELVIDLGGEFSVTGLRYLTRQDGGWNGAFGQCEIFVSNSAREFNEPAGKATFKKQRTAQSVNFKSTQGRYVLIRVLSEVNGGPWASAAEIGLTGSRSQ